MPGRSSTPISEIFASSRLNAMPEMIACSMSSSSSNVISVPFGVDSLKARDDDNRAIGQVLAHPLFVDLQDARLRERAVGQHADLSSCVASRLEPHVAKRDREKPDRHLLTGCRDDVELARTGTG